MDLRAQLQLQSMIKSMTDVVLPALDPDNDMAQEQAHLIVGMLQLMAIRLPLQHHYDVDALRRYLETADELLRLAAGGPATPAPFDDLSAARTRCADVLDGAISGPAELEAAILELRSRISALVTWLWREGEPDSRAAAARAVLDAAQAQILRERAWFAPQGWDADMSAYPAIESLIDFRVETSSSGASES